jgi:hypothetical protein
VSTALERLVGKDAPLDRRTRIGGAFILLVGTFLAKVAIVDTLQEAERHRAHELSVSFAVAIVPAALLLGMVMLLGGGRIVGWAKRLGLERRPDGSRSVRTWLLTGLMLAPGFALYFWLEHRLAEIGYGR